MIQNLLKLHFRCWKLIACKSVGKLCLLAILANGGRWRALKALVLLELKLIGSEQVTGVGHVSDTVKIYRQFNVMGLFIWI